MPGRSGRDADRELIGRSAALGQFADALSEASTGQVRRMLVHGAPGLGKTTLLDAFGRHARRAGAICLRVTCPPEPDPLGAVRLLLGGLPGTRPSVSPSHQLRARVTALCADQPVVILVDDAQWCDEQSAASLDLLDRSAGGLPLVIVTAGAPESSPASRPHHEIVLAPFTGEEAMAFAELFWERPPAAAVRAGNEACGGNPVLLRQLFDRLHATGADEEEDAARIGAELSVQRLLATLDRQPDHVRAMVDRAIVDAIAVLGGTDIELIAMLTGLSERLVLASLEVLRSERIAEALRHEHVRAAVLGDMAPELLDRLREAAARLLNDTGRPVEEVAAQVVPLSELREPWLYDVLRDAARAAERRGEPAEAERFLRRLVTAAPDDVENRLNLARMAGRRDPAAAYEILSDALRRVVDPPLRARLAVQLGRFAIMLRRETETVPMIAGILAELPAGTGAELRAETEAALLLAGWSNRASAPGVLARAATEPDGHSPGERELLAVRSLLSAVLGGPAAPAVARARAALGVERENPSCSFGLACYVLAMADATDESVRAMDRVIAAVRERSNSWTLMMLLSMRSRVLGWSGDLSGATADAVAAIDLSRDRPWRNQAAAGSVLAAALVQQGDLEGAAAALEGLPGGSVVDDATVLTTRASIAAFRGDPERALDHLRACGAMLDSAGVRHPVLTPWWLDAVCLLTELGRGPEARELVERGEEIAADWGGVSARGLARLARGAVTEGPAGITALTDAVRALDDAPGRWYLVRAETLLGQALLRSGDAKGARLHLRRAVDLSVRAGYRRLTEVTRAALVAAGGRMYQVTGSAMDVLTRGERRVVELAVTGATNQEIADTLLISLRTVETHLTSVYRKLVVTGRAELRAALHPAPASGTGPDETHTLVNSVKRPADNFPDRS